jgi:hypothetical protein
MAKTYTPIATVTASGSVSSITFSSISGSYTDLILMFEGKTGTADEWGLRFNSDTGSNYSSSWIAGGSNPAQSSRYTNISFATLNYIRTERTIAIANIQNYSNSLTYKTVIARTSEPNNAWACASLWRSTAAITSVTIFSYNGYNFNNTSTVTLYGIKAA